MAVRAFDGTTPTMGERVLVDELALVTGDVALGDDSSVWPAAVIRGDIHRIRIGARSSIQDGTVIHVTHAGPYHPEGFPTTVGDDVTVGHNVTLHGCTIGDRVLVGMGAVVLDGAVVEPEVVIAAGALVPPGKHLESGCLYVGSPVRQARPLSEEERRFFLYSAESYVKLKDRHLEQGAAG